MLVQTIETPYKITPIGARFVRRARIDGLDDQMQTVERSIAKGGEPCRDVLRRALPGEEIILASYCPFERASPYREYGPVFILATESLALTDSSYLPITGDPAYFHSPFVLRAYSQEERIVDAAITAPDTAHQILQKFFQRDEVAFVLARFAAYGCYACRLDRVNEAL